MNVKLKMQNVKGILLASFFIFHFSFFIVNPVPAFAVGRSFDVDPNAAGTIGPIAQFCFTKEECAAAPYSGIPSEGAAPECLDKNNQDARYLQAGFVYNCYAPQKPYKLQVPFLTPLFKGQVSSLEDYLASFFQFLISISAVVAGIMIVWAGVKWLTSAGYPERISDAKKKIGNAAVGLVLVLSSYLILQTLNPALVRLQLPPVKLFRQSQIAGKTDCIPRAEFACGQQYDCSRTGPADNPQGWLSNPPCGEFREGECLGRWCNGAEQQCGVVLSAALPERLAGLGFSNNELVAIANLRDRKTCVDPSACSNCESIVITSGINSPIDFDNLRLCANEHCSCRVRLGGQGEPRLLCKSRAEKGQSCESNSDCRSGQCNLAVRAAGAPLVGQYGVCGPSELDSPCQEDNDCKSGICNQAFDPDECQAPSSLSEGEDCDRQILCQSGLICTGFGPVIGADKECKRIE